MLKQWKIFLTIIAILSLVLVPIGCRSNTADSFIFDELPSEVMLVVYLSGTEYEMGYQYGQQVGEYLHAEKVGQWDYILDRIDRVTAEEAIAEMASVIEEEFTEIDYLDIYEGMAQGAQERILRK